jgi:hypothetical protein
MPWHGSHDDVMRKKLVGWSYQMKEAAWKRIGGYCRRRRIEEGLRRKTIEKKIFKKTHEHMGLVQTYDISVVCFYEKIDM